MAFLQKLDLSLWKSNPHTYLPAQVDFPSQHTREGVYAVDEEYFQTETYEIGA